MFIVRLLRWLSGSVSFLITGIFPERFINLCLRLQLPLWDVTPTKKGYEAATYASNYRALRPIAKKTGTKIRIKHKQGLPFIRFRYRKRWGLAVGIVTAALLTSFLSTRIWSIEIVGCEALDPDAIELQLSEMGLKPGVSARGVKVTELERRMLLECDGVAWISINIKSSTATVEISEGVPPPQKINPKDRAANVVAAQDGQLKYLEVYNGQPMVVLGDTVSAGDVIVSGVMEDKHGNTRMVFARAKAVARVYEQLRAEVPLTQMVLLPCGESYLEKRLVIAGKAIDLFLPKRPVGDSIKRETSVKILSVNPKILLEVTVCTPMAMSEVTLTPFEAKEKAMEIIKEAENNLGIYSIISKETTQGCQNNVYFINEMLTIEKDIAKQVEIYINGRQSEDSMVQ